MTRFEEYMAKARARGWGREHLRLELLDWIARSQHEARLAFDDQDMIRALVWGSKVGYFRHELSQLKELGYETGPDVEEIAAHMLFTAETIDNGFVSRAGRALLDPGIRIYCQETMRQLEELHRNQLKALAMNLPDGIRGGPRDSGSGQALKALSYGRF